MAGPALPLFPFILFFLNRRQQAQLATTPFGPLTPSLGPNSAGAQLSPLSPCQAVAQPAPPARSPLLPSGPLAHVVCLAQPAQPAGRPSKPRPSLASSRTPFNPSRAATLLPDPAAARTPAPPAPLLDSHRMYLPGHGHRGWLEPPRSPSAQRYKRVATAPPLSSPCSRRSPPEPRASALARRALRASPSQTPRHRAPSHRPASSHGR